MAAKKKSPAPSRSKKAGRPPAEPASSSPGKSRRRKSATAAVSKGTTLLQSDRGARAAWSGSKPAWKKG
jgi:hypothetical protein